MKEDIRFCRCIVCGNHMTLGYDVINKEYIALCEKCEVFEPISNADRLKQLCNYLFLDIYLREIH
jgi:hypothetical protein